MPLFTDKDLKKDISSGNFSGIYLLYGDEKYLISFYEKKLTDKIIKGNDTGFNLMVFDGGNINFYDLSLAIESFPVGSDKKCIVIKNLNVDSLKSDEIQSLYNIISDIPEFSVLIISQTSLKTDLKKSIKWNNFIKEASKYGKPVAFSVAGKASAEKQLIKWAKSLNKTLSEENAALMVERCGREYNVLRNELSKVCALEQSDEITQDTVRNITVSNLEADVFEMYKKLMAHNYTEAYKYMDMLFARKEQPIAILGALASGFTDIHRVKAAAEGGYGALKVAESFDYKKKEFKLNIAQRYSQNMDMSTIHKLIEALTEADFKLKSFGINSRIIMDELFVKIIKLSGKGA